MADTPAHLTTREFAERTDLSVSTVSQYLRDGKIEGKKESGRWLIPEDQVERFLAGVSEAAGTTASKADEAKTAPPEKSAPKSAPAADAYSVDEFSRLTFLTPAGVVKYLKEGILEGGRREDGSWTVAAGSLENKRIQHLIR